MKRLIAISALLLMASPVLALDRIDQLIDLWQDRNNLAVLINSVSSDRYLVIDGTNGRYKCTTKEANEVNELLVRFLAEKTEEIKRNKELLK